MLSLPSILGLNSLYSATLTSICQYNFTPPTDSLLNCLHPSNPWFNQCYYNNFMICTPFRFIFTSSDRKIFGEDIA